MDKDRFVNHWLEGAREGELQVPDRKRKCFTDK